MQRLTKQLPSLRAGFALCAAATIITAVVGCSAAADPHAAFQRGDYEDALRLWRERAAHGDSEAENYLGIHYQLGLGVPRDYGRAVRWYQRAAENGYADAQRNLGTMYQLGYGVAKDNQLAYGWYHYAAVQGNRVARDYIVAMTSSLTPNQIMQAREIVGRQIKHQTQLADASDIGTENAHEMP